MHFVMGRAVLVDRYFENESLSSNENLIMKASRCRPNKTRSDGTVQLNYKNFFWFTVCEGNFVSRGKTVCGVFQFMKVAPLIFCQPKSESELKLFRRSRQTKTEFTALPITFRVYLRAGISKRVTVPTCRTKLRKLNVKLRLHPSMK